MNERIRELLKQAEERYPKHLAVAVPEVVLRQDALELFAKLIVSECMDVLDPGENQLIARFQARQWLAEHFGVE